MTALTEARQTLNEVGGVTPNVRSFPVAASVLIYQGSIVMLDGGYAKPGATATGKKAVGRAAAQADNSSGSAGDINVEVDCGVFKFGNSSAGDAIAQADVGNICYLVDDQTVAKTSGSGTRSSAGTILAVDSGGVWVQLEPYTQPSDVAVISDFTSAQHDHGDAAGGGALDFTGNAHDHEDAAGGGQLTDAALSAAVGEAKGGTNQTTYAQGDVLYASAADTLGKLAIGTARNFLRANAAGTLPEYATPAALSGAALSFTAGDIALTPVCGAHYDVPTTAGASTISLQVAGAARGDWCVITADGTKNGHTVQYRTGTTNISAALTASKQHMVHAMFDGTAWACIAHESP